MKKNKKMMHSMKMKTNINNTTMITRAKGKDFVENKTTGKASS